MRALFGRTPASTRVDPAGAGGRLATSARRSTGGSPPAHGLSHFLCQVAAGLALLGAAAAAVGAAEAAGPADAPFRPPYLPDQPAAVLQTVPAASNPRIRDMRALRAKLDAAPKDLAVASRLADAYIDFGREVGDAHYAGYAEAVIAPWLAQPEPPPSVLVAYATILQYRHQFPEARQQLMRALARDDRNRQAWLTLATLDMVQGDHAAAGRGCSKVAAAGAYELGLVCNAALGCYAGQSRKSLSVLALVSRGLAEQPGPIKPWIEGLMAECAERIGDWDEAERHHRQALAAAPDDNFLLVAFADFLLDRDRPKDVLPLLAGREQSDTAFLRIALARAALREPDAGRYVWIMSARFEALQQRGSEFFGREQARFALHLQHDPAAALHLAQQNWNAQREPWDCRALLEAALAANDPKAAAPVIEFVEKTRLEDVRVRRLIEELRAATGPRSGGQP